MIDPHREVMDRVTKLVGEPPSSLTRSEVDAFLRRYYAQVDVEDLEGRSDSDLAGAALRHLRIGLCRPGDTTIISIANPTVEVDGWHSPHTSIDIVTTDCQFLIDSISIVFARRGISTELLVHPVERVQRNADGIITGFGESERDAQTHIEAWMHLEVDRQTDPMAIAQLERELRDSLTEVLAINEDDAQMHEIARSLATRFTTEKVPVPQKDVEEAVELLSWLATDSFQFLGYREYRLHSEANALILRAEPGSGLGLLREALRPPKGNRLSDMSPDHRRRFEDRDLLIVTKDGARSPIVRDEYFEYIGVKIYGDDGAVVGEHRFLGLFAAGVFRQSIFDIPFLREKAEQVITASAMSPTSYLGRELVDTLEVFPRDQLFEISAAELTHIAVGITKLQERKQVRVFGRRDSFGRFLSVLVYLPRDRFSNAIAERIVETLKELCGGDSTEHEARVTERINARVHVLIRLRDDAPSWVDDELIEQRVSALTRWWIDDVREELEATFGEGPSALALATLAQSAFPDAYRDSYQPSIAIVDLDRIQQLSESRPLLTALVHQVEAPPSDWRFKIYAHGSPLALSSVLPYLENLGVEVIDEQPFALATEPQVWLQDIGIRLRNGSSLDSEAVQAEFQSTFLSLWRSEIENDGLNQLVARISTLPKSDSNSHAMASTSKANGDLPTGLQSRQIAILRAYAHYLRQVGIPFTPTYIEATLLNNASITRQLVDLFEAMFHPQRNQEDTVLEEIRGSISRSLDDVSSLDEDRILRAFLSVICATTRTNAYRADALRETTSIDAPFSSALSFKFDPTQIPDLPLPRPKFEIWVYSPRVEGVHLRGGDIARGGLRWSDRREDFRTEVLGLMKAQMVKNAVIVPGGAKGGFFPKQLPSDPALRKAEAVACYDIYISALLDVTDNLVRGEVVAPVGVIRRDNDDPYLVVAADKGTATFSDIANSISKRYGFWLGDAFASGGSAGYDHKGMGITARGAWESVRRHMRTTGRNIDTDQITVVGIGDMSGDVFGNGMLLSNRLQLVAAFDHRHIFLDPNPDPALSFAERARLFALPSSSWDDYDKSQISTGGGVWSRSAKSIALSPEIRRVLGIEDSVQQLVPVALMSAILRAPVDLFWNGGIGTYVKASTEQHSDAGDRTNDALRIDGSELRCKMVGEGGNLGFTQRGRIEYALSGGLINTDAIDNSAGVDCSDHEVNIKIALGSVVEAEQLTLVQRNEVLSSMTDEVAELVLDDNRAQNLALAIARRQAVAMSDVHARQIRFMELNGQINRRLEFLPDEKQLAERHAGGNGLTTPEFAILLAYTKEITADAVLGSDLPDDEYLHDLLHQYFPKLLRDRFPNAIDAHRLKREIVTTCVVNEMVNHAGLSFMHRMIEEASSDEPTVTRAHIAARDIFGLQEQWEEVDALPTTIDCELQIDLFMVLRRMVERGVLWLLRHRRSPIPLHATVESLQPGVRELMGAFPDLLIGSFGTSVSTQMESYQAAGIPESLARRAVGWPYLHTAPDIVELAQAHHRTALETATTYWHLFDRLDLTWLWEQISRLPRTDRWRTQARAALRDDLLHELRALTNDVLVAGLTPQSWCEVNAAPRERTLKLFADIRSQGVFDLSTLTVALRQVRNLTLATSSQRG
jgi:glutamate dehydrogenase